MRSETLVCLTLLCATPIPALAQPPTAPGVAALPPGINPETGARPGNPIGAGQSLPMSDKAANITPEDTHSIIAPNLPAPPVPHPASPLDYLIAARMALAEGRTGEAQEALERAETRAIIRAVPPELADQPVVDPLVEKIRKARLALAANDLQRAMLLVDSAHNLAEQAEASR